MEAGDASGVFDGVLVASPAWVAGELLGTVDPELGSALGGIPYSSSITVNLVYDEARLGPLPEGFGFLVPASEHRAMLACTFVHRKFLGRTPPGKSSVRRSPSPPPRASAPLAPWTTSLAARASPRTTAPVLAAAWRFFFLLVEGHRLIGQIVVH